MTPHATPLRPRRALAATAAALALVLASCGSDDTASDDTTTDAPAPQATSQATEPAEPVESSEPAESTGVPVSDVLGTNAETLAGDKVDEATQQGRPTVLWFWAPWCHVCRSEGPGVADVAAKYGSEVNLVGIPGLGEVTAMDQFVSDTGTGDFPHVPDQSGDLWKQFGVTAQPAYAFVDADGKVVEVTGGLGEDDLKSSIDDLLAG